MNENHDALEAELGALRPHRPSPGLEQAIAGRLEGAPVKRARWPWGVAFAGGLAAACVAAAIFLARERDPGQGTGRTIVADLPTARAAFDDSLPTLQVYQRALMGAPGELEVLLDKHAAGTLPPEPAETRIRAFSLMNVELNTWTGEL